MGPKNWYGFLGTYDSVFPTWVIKIHLEVASKSVNNDYFGKVNEVSSQQRFSMTVVITNWLQTSYKLVHKLLFVRFFMSQL